MVFKKRREEKEIRNRRQANEAIASLALTSTEECQLDHKNNKKQKIATAV